LARARRRDDQAALALADWRQQIHDARRERLLAEFELDALMRIDRRHLVEVAARVFVGRKAMDGRHVLEPRPRAARGRLRRAANLNATAQLKFLQYALIDERIGLLCRVVLRGIAQEAVAFLM